MVSLSPSVSQSVHSVCPSLTLIWRSVQPLCRSVGRTVSRLFQSVSVCVSLCLSVTESVCQGQGQGSRVKDRGSRVEGRGSRSRVEGQGSRVKGQGSRVKGQAGRQSVRGAASVSVSVSVRCQCQCQTVSGSVRQSGSQACPVPVGRSSAARSWRTRRCSASTSDNLWCSRFSCRVVCLTFPSSPPRRLPGLWLRYDQCPSLPCFLPRRTPFFKVAVTKMPRELRQAMVDAEIADFGFASRASWVSFWFTKGGVRHQSPSRRRLKKKSGARESDQGFHGGRCRCLWLVCPTSRLQDKSRAVTSVCEVLCRLGIGEPRKDGLELMEECKNPTNGE